MFPPPVLEQLQHLLFFSHSLRQHLLLAASTTAFAAGSEIRGVQWLADLLAHLDTWDGAVLHITSNRSAPFGGQWRTLGPIPNGKQQDCSLTI